MRFNLHCQLYILKFKARHTLDNVKGQSKTEMSRTVYSIRIYMYELRISQSNSAGPLNLPITEFYCRITVQNSLFNYNFILDHHSSLPLKEKKNHTKQFTRFETTLDL